MHPVFITLYQRYQETIGTPSHSIFPDELHQIFIANKSLFDAWLPDSNKYKNQLSSATALKIINAANSVKFRWFCKIYNKLPSVTAEHRVVFLDDPYVQLLIESSNDIGSFPSAYAYITAVPSEQITSLLNSVKILKAKSRWCTASLIVEILCSNQSMSPILWDKQVNVIIQLSQSPYDYDDMYAAPSNSFFDLIKKHLKEHHSPESFVKLFSLMDEIIILNLKHKQLDNNYYGYYRDIPRVRLYIAMICTYIPMISGDIDAAIKALDRLIKEDECSLWLIDSKQCRSFVDINGTQLDSTLKILLATPDYETNAGAVQHLRQHLDYKNIITILTSSLVCKSQVVNAFRYILKTQASFLKTYQNRFIQILLEGVPYEGHVRLLTLLHGLNIIDAALLDKSFKTSWLNLPSEHRNVLVLYLKLFQNNNFLVADVYNSLVQNIQKIFESPILSSLPECYDLITSKMFKDEILSKPSLEIFDRLENLLKLSLDTPLELECRTLSSKTLQIVTEDVIPPPFQNEEVDSDEETPVVEKRREVTKTPAWMKLSRTEEQEVTASAVSSTEMDDVKEPREYTSKPGWMKLKSHLDQTLLDKPGVGI